ncbi:hypothetical protein DORFOR_02268 [Dorea formicigenerans ATCC 27755]|uniref:Uncharacterized protein n=1 Tax=Dorea formicigenerans ATCC 27755 TaxID=411461 RepID=B0G7L3_9FIRM|nr:hypothetical protein DORFOR_02268 [Dorea formicigenerans ATCC 27755]
MFAVSCTHCQRLYLSKNCRTFIAEGQTLLENSINKKEADYKA